MEYEVDQYGYVLDSQEVRACPADLERIRELTMYPMSYAEALGFCLLVKRINPQTKKPFVCGYLSLTQEAVDALQVRRHEREHMGIGPIIGMGPQFAGTKLVQDALTTARIVAWAAFDFMMEPDVTYDQVHARLQEMHGRLLIMSFRYMPKVDRDGKR